MFNLFSWITNGVREAVLAGFCQAVQVVKTGEPGDSPEARRLLELTSQEPVPEPLSRLLDHEATMKAVEWGRKRAFAKRQSW